MLVITYVTYNDLRNRTYMNIIYEKRTFLYHFFAFYKEKDIEQRTTQKPITDFLPNWNTLANNYYSASDDSTDDEGPRPHYSRQLTISNWLKSNSVRRGVVQGSSSNGRASLS